STPPVICVPIASCLLLLQRLGRHPPCRDGGQDNDEPLRQAPSRSLRPTGSCRSGHPEPVDRSISGQPGNTRRQPVQSSQTHPEYPPPTYSLPAPAQIRGPASTAAPTCQVGILRTSRRSCSASSRHSGVVNLEGPFSGLDQR